MASLNRKELTMGVAGISGRGILLPEGKEWRERADRVILLLDEWSASDPGYDEETWPGLKKSLEKNRTSKRKLFDGR